MAGGGDRSRLSRPARGRGHRRRAGRHQNGRDPDRRPPPSFSSSSACGAAIAKDRGDRLRGELAARLLRRPRLPSPRRHSLSSQSFRRASMATRVAMVKSQVESRAGPAASKLGRARLGGAAVARRDEGCAGPGHRIAFPQRYTNVRPGGSRAGAAAATRAGPSRWASTAKSPPASTRRLPLRRRGEGRRWPGGPAPWLQRTSRWRTFLGGAFSREASKGAG